MLKKKKQFTASLSFHHEHLAKHLIAWPQGSKNCNLFPAQSTAPTPLLSSQAEPEHFSKTPLTIVKAIFIVLFSLPSLRTFSHDYQNMLLAIPHQWLLSGPLPTLPGGRGYLRQSPCFNTTLRLIIPSHFYSLHVSWNCFDACVYMCMYLCTW